MTKSPWQIDPHLLPMTLVVCNSPLGTPHSASESFPQMAALEMAVTPHITSADQISLKINITNNRPDFSNLVQGQPALQIKEAQTSVLVADGDTTVIGGVFASESASSRDTVPGLSKIPLLGYLFRNHSENLTRNEMLVFITPHIVTREKAK